jgi:tetratricopeptide (TPR) repeat protein
MSLYAESLPLALSLGDDEAVSHTKLLMAALFFTLGRYNDAEEHSQQGLEIARSIGSTQRIIGHLHNLAALAYVHGDYDGSRRYFEEMLNLAEATGYVEGSISSLTELGEVINRTDPVGAEATLLRAERLANASGYMYSLCAIHANLGRALLSQGEMARAKQRLDQALQEAHDMKSPWFVAVVSNLLGEWYLKEGRSLGEAYGSFNEVRVLGESTDISEHRAATLFGLARVAVLQGDLAAAHTHAQESLMLYTDMRHVMAAEVQRWLDTLPTGPQPPA